MISGLDGIDLENTTSVVLKLPLSHVCTPKPPQPLSGRRQMCVQAHTESEQNSSPATPYTSREWRHQCLALQAPANPEEQVWSPGRGTPWTPAIQAPLSMEFSWQEYWSGSPCLAPGDLSNSETEPRSSTGFFYRLSPYEVHKWGWGEMSTRQASRLRPPSTPPCLSPEGRFPVPRILRRCWLVPKALASHLETN